MLYRLDCLGAVADRLFLESFVVGESGTPLVNAGGS